jgi:hypothetical protein
MAVISIAQPGHFIDKHCSWPPGKKRGRDAAMFDPATLAASRKVMEAAEFRVTNP